MKKQDIIADAGGSASGKTKVVSEILEKLKIDCVTIIKHDDYYKDQKNLSIKMRKNINYDHPNSIDNDLFYEHLEQLLQGKSISKPLYDFVYNTRKQEKETVNPKKVIILEGILVLTDERIRDLADIKLYVELDPDLRFIRRLNRDINERGRSVESVMKQYLATVKPSHHQFVEPTKRYADVIIPNNHKYDVAVDIIVAKIKMILGED